MSDFLRYSLMRTVPAREEVAGKIRDCREILAKNVHGAPVCRGEALETAEDFAARFTSCMTCYRAVSNARGLIGHADSDLKTAFAHIDTVLSACNAAMWAVSDRLPPPISEL